MPLKQKSFRRYRALAAILLLFQKGLTPSDVTDTVDKSDDEEPMRGRIRCPLCRWQPDSGSSWVCADCPYPEYFLDGCGAEWNTFDTRGLCPGCGHQWRWTSCLSCEKWSLHEDWYAPRQEDDE
jgi:hypothetical protein